MPVQIQIRHGDAAAWLSADPTLALGEIGAETDTGLFKVGDGATAWSALAYSIGAAGGTPAVVLGTTAAAGSAPTFLRDDDTIVAFDATAPETQGYDDAADAGTATVAARRDHLHGMPSASSGGGVTVEDEGSPLATIADTLDFVGAGVVASGTGTTKTITISGAAVADILDLPTAEMDDTLVYGPDGAGGVQARAEAGGGGGGGVTTPTVIQSYRGVNSPFTLGAAPTVGNRLVLGIVTLGGSTTAISSANTTWTQIGTDQAQNGNNTSIWVGVCAGSPGATITITHTGTSLALVLEVADALTPTVGATVVEKTTIATNSAATGRINVTAGHFLAAASVLDNGANGAGLALSVPFTGMMTASQYSSFVIGYAPSGDVLAFIPYAWTSTVIYLVEIT
jgi:hypothetical protein